MADVFVSHSRSDRPKVEPIVAALRGLGLEVWFDVELAAGASFAEEISRKVQRAKAVLVLWSLRSVESEWVRAEALVGRDRDVLVPAFLEVIDLPPPWNTSHTEDLSRWKGDQSDPAWQKIVTRIAQLTGRPELLAKRPSLNEPASRDELYPGQEQRAEPGRKYLPPRGAKGKKVFIAHASADKQRLRPFVESLVDVGFSVWIDKPYELQTSERHLTKLSNNRIHYGSDWKESIRKAINRCDRVLAFWSLDAVEGRREQFHYEVYQALVQGKLRQCRLDKVDYTSIGFPYTFHHIADLSVVSAGSYHQALQDLMTDIAQQQSGKL